MTLCSRTIPRCPKCRSRRVRITHLAVTNLTESLEVRRSCAACRHTAFCHLHDLSQPRWHPGTVTGEIAL